MQRSLRHPLTALLSPLGALLLLLPGLARPSPQEPATAPPDKRELEGLIQEYLELGSRAVGPERERQLEIQARLSALPDLSAEEEARWRKELQKAWEKLPGLPAEKGDNWYFEDPRRGRYIVGGKRSKPAGLLIGMHGGGVGSGDAGSIAPLYEGAAARQKWVALFPEVLEKTERGWTDAGTEEWILDLIEQARRSFSVDADRVYLAGHSMGGYGAWTLGAHHADRVAALAPAAGGPTPILDRATGKPTDIDWGVIPSLRNVPMVVYQSRDDPQVPADVNQLAAKQVAEARARWGGYTDFTYWEVDGQGHGLPPGGAEAHFERIRGFVRQARPKEIVWQPVLSWKRQFYWLAWERPAEGALLEARLDREANRISVTRQAGAGRGGGPGLAVYVDAELVDFDRPLEVLLDGQVVFSGQPRRRLEWLLETSTSGDDARRFSARVPLEPQAAR
jgi:poly(3-hydroxybutyrate) depolymerase